MLAPHPSFWAGCYCCSGLVHNSQSLASFSLNLGVFGSFSLFMTLLKYHRNQKVFPDLLRLTARIFIPSSIFLLALIIWNEQVHLFIYLLIPYIVSLKVKYGQNWVKCIGLLYIIVCVYCICTLCVIMDSLLIRRTWIYNCCCCVPARLCPALWDPMRCSSPGFSVHGIFPGKNIGVGCYFLFQGIFPAQGWNPASVASPTLAGGFFTNCATWEALNLWLSSPKMPFK